MKSAIRRHHKERMRKKCKRIYPYDLHMKNADNLKPCSCWGCGNPRKWYKAITRKEYLSLLYFCEEMDLPRPRKRKSI